MFMSSQYFQLFCGNFSYSPKRHVRITPMLSIGSIQDLFMAICYPIDNVEKKIKTKNTAELYQPSGCWLKYMLLSCLEIW